MNRFIAKFVASFAMVFAASALFAGTVEKTFMTNQTAQKQLGDLSMYKIVATRASLPRNGDTTVGTPNWYDYANSTDFANGGKSAIFYFQATNASTQKDEWVLIDAPNYSPDSFYKLGIPRVGKAEDVVNMVVTGSNVYTSYSSANMPLFANVTANADGVKSLTNQNIILEFWGFNYGNNAQASKPDQNGNAFALPTSNPPTTGYDWNDTPADNGDHGSYQIHLYDSTSQTGQTLFGLSRLYRTTTGNTIDAGIGNSNKGDALDWTMAPNAAAADHRSLQVLAIPNYAEGSLIYNASAGKTWGESGAWLNPDGTTAAGVPTADTPTHVNVGTVQVTDTAFAQSLSLEPNATIDVKSGASLTIGSAFTTNGTVRSAGALTISGDFIVGRGLDTGKLITTGGTLRASNIYISNTNGSTAEAELTNTTVSGLGTFKIANEAGSTGTAKIHEGTSVTSTNFDVGYRGNGTLYMDGGNITTSSYFCIGNNVASANGTVYHSGGTIQTPWMPLGHYGQGTYNLSGSGKIVVTGAGSMDQPTAANNGLEIGDRKGSSVTFNMSGGEIQSNGWIYIGRVGTGVMNLSGGTVKANTGIVLGHITDGDYKGNGTLNATGGTITTANLYISNNTPGKATLTNTTLNVSSRITLGNQTTGAGELTINDGTVIKCNEVAIGNSGQGTVVMNGGSLTTNSWFLLGFNNNGVDNVMTQNGGDVNVAWFTMQWDRSGGTSTYNMNGGTLTSNGTSQGNGMVLAKNGNATFNMNGGTVTTKQASTSNIGWAGYALSVGTGVSNGNAVLNISGGEMNALGKTYIKNGSAVNYLTNGDQFGLLAITGDLEQYGLISVTHTGDVPDWVDPVTIMTVSGNGVPTVTNNSKNVYEDFWYLDEKALKLQTKAGTVDFGTEAEVELPEGLELKTGWVDFAGADSTRSFNLEIATEDMDSFMTALNAQLEAEYGDGATATKKDGQTAEISLNFAELGDLDRFTWNFTGAEFNGAAVTGISSNYVPEPTAWLLLILGAAGILAVRRKK